MSREHVIPCRRLGCFTVTFNDSGFCSDGCARLYAARAGVRRLARCEGAGEWAPTSSLAPTSTEVASPGPLGERGTRPLVGPGPASSLGAIS